MGLSSRHPVVCFGEVLWDVLPTGALPGGAPMNVAYHLKRLGTHPAIISKVGTDSYGEKLVNIFSNQGVETRYIQVDNQQQTGLVYANVSDSHEVTYDIVYPSAWDFIEWKEELPGLGSQADF
ncbi:MAG TPA: PfkB family carbohydrate kinase, partial [Flavisolibacter sp.]